MSVSGDEEEPQGLSFPTGDTMCITLKQLFASAIIEEIKKMENRTWALKLPADGSGRWIGAAGSPSGRSE